MDEWLAHLTAAGGRQSDDLDWHFPGNDGHRTHAGQSLVPLTHLSILECEGPDAARFLQGQTSANIEHANGAFAPLTAFCTPKGRMIANAEVLKVAAERYWLLLDASLATALATQLGKYAPFYKMTLHHRQDLALIGMVGAPEGWASEVDLPRLDWHMTQRGDATVVRHPASHSRFLLILPASQAAAACHALSQNADLADTALWRRADIGAGIAWLTAAHSDTLLPQMINWEALGGISFRKGCYTGQEVVARAHFRGQVKRRLQLATLESESLPAIGEEIRTADDKRVGEVFQAATSASAEHCEVLVVISTNADSETGLFVGNAKLSLCELPYPLERLDPETVTA